MAHFTHSLEDMEIAIPPHSGNKQETAEYGRTMDRYAGRSLPYAPRPKLPAKSIARRPVGSSLRREDQEAPLQRLSCEALAAPKPLPPEPSRTQNEFPRGQSPNDPPTGHKPSRKILKLMGAEVNISDDGIGSPSQSSSVEGSRSSTVYTQDDLEGSLKQGTPVNLVCPSTLPQEWRANRHSRTRHFCFEQKLPTSRGCQQFSDYQTAHEYHRFAKQLGSKTELVDSNRETSPSRARGVSWHSFLSTRRRSPPPRLALSNQGAFERSQLRRSQSPYAGERPTSAFDSDSDDEESARIVDSIRGFFTPKFEADSETGAKRQSHREGMFGFIDRSKERFARKREEELERRRKQLRRDIKFIAGEMIDSSGRA